MPLFLVTYLHPDREGWLTHLGPHLEWIAAQVESGTLRASGPTELGDIRSAALIIDSPDRATLESTLATDPFVEHGQVGELTITPWDPIFGILNDHSSQPGRTTRQIVSDTLAAFGAAETSSRP